jgi:hypothetical protein
MHCYPVLRLGVRKRDGRNKRKRSRAAPAAQTNRGGSNGSHGFSLVLLGRES